MRTTMLSLFLVYSLYDCPAGAAPVKSSPSLENEEIQKIIEQLLDVDRRDTGHEGSLSNSSFLPYGNVPVEAAASRAADTMKKLVKLGPNAIPALLDHLGDDRATKYLITHSGGFGSMSILIDEGEPKEPQPARGVFQETQYTVKVGDLCYVAIGQIVNRKYEGISYSPSRFTFVHCVPKMKKLREEAIRSWSNLTPARHRESLVRDFTDAKDDRQRNGAILRLSYYYPKDVEPLALKHLAAPTYSYETVRAFVEKKLYPAESGENRKKLVGALVAENGEIARDGLRYFLFQSLKEQEQDERNPPRQAKLHFARQCLMDVFGLPESVSSEDRPKQEPLNGYQQADFVDSLRHCNSAKVDEAIRGILVKTNDQFLFCRSIDHLVGRGYDADIEKVLKRWCEHNPDGQSYFANYFAKLGWTRLHAAVDHGWIEGVEAALPAGNPIDSLGRDGRTALHIASARQYGCALEIVRLLLKAGADPNIRDGQGRLAIELAAYNDDLKTVKCLAAHKSERPDVFSCVLLDSPEDLAAVLKKNPAAVKLRNEFGPNPLHVASREGHAEIVRLLIAAGADVKALDNFTEKREYHRFATGKTPLHHAKTQAVAKLLIDQGADVNAVDESMKRTPLHYAAQRGDLELVQLLILNKADRAMADKDKRTPSVLARDAGHTEIVELLSK